jgi:transcriptional regulator of arginine metabolism
MNNANNIMNCQTKYQPQLLMTFKTLLSEQYFASQLELANALSLKGFGKISQAKISRMLSKVGAVRTRNAKNEMVYHLPDQAMTPKTKQTINSMVLGIKHNGAHIILKTILGGAALIARILETMGESAGILGCIADDNTILVIPTDIQHIEEITQTIIEHLEVNGH